MFTGIIEALGRVKSIERDRSNVHFTIESQISGDLKIDQSLSHNGACLTVVEVRSSEFEVPSSERLPQTSNFKLQTSNSELRTPNSELQTSNFTSHRVTAVEETLRRTNLGAWQLGTLVNLERCLPMGGRLDGHIVQGHVDAVAECVEVLETGGSWRITFRYAPTPEHLLVDKGSVCLNGVSLTVVEPVGDLFSVAIIPYTWEHTNFHALRAGDAVNIEFDIIGKYIARHLAAYGAAFFAK
jgi:riboflavin synthase